MRTKHNVSRWMRKKNGHECSLFRSEETRQSDIVFRIRTNWKQNTLAHAHAHTRTHTTTITCLHSYVWLEIDQCALHSIFLNCKASFVRKTIQCNISTFCYTMHSIHSHKYIHIFTTIFDVYMLRKLLFKLDRVFVYIIIHPDSSICNIHWEHRCI